LISQIRELEGSPLTWHAAIDSNFQVMPSIGKFSKEEQLQWERKRLVTSGITSYEFHLESGRIIFPAAGSMFHCTDAGSLGVSNLLPVELKTNCGAARLNCQISPQQNDLVAFVASADLWVTHIGTGKAK
jgi:dipeptidyl-peptidase 9